MVVLPWSAFCHAGEKQRDLKRAFDDLTESIRLSPTSPELWLFRGIISAIPGKQRNLKHAYDDLTVAIQLSDDPTAFFLRAQILQLQNDFDNAIADHERAIQNYPQDSLNKTLCLAWLLSTFPKDEVRDGKRALRSRPKS